MSSINTAADTKSRSRLPTDPTSDDKRSSSSKPARKGKVPVLTSAHLRNLCPLSKEDLHLQNKDRKWYRPAYDTALLNQVRLDLVIVPPKSNPDDQKSEKDADASHRSSSSMRNRFDKTVIYSSLAPTKTINPSWNHLDEIIEDYLKLDGYFDSETGFYRYMRLQIWIVPEHKNDCDTNRVGTSNGSTTDYDDTKSVLADDNADSSERSTTTGTTCTSANAIIGETPLMDIGIHPSKLKRLVRTPERVPINALVLNFSDGSVRVTASLRDAIGDQEGSSKDEHLKDEFGRFGDDAFRTLDSVTPVKKTRDYVRDPYPSDPADESHSEDAYTDTPNHNNKTAEQTKVNEHQQILSEMEDKFLFIERDASKEDICSKQQELERLIALEEAALQAEVDSLQAEKLEMQTLMQTASQIEKDIALLDKVVREEIQLCRKSEFFLEAQRLKLLRDLQKIYPITIAFGAEEKYCIRGLRIPADIYGGGVPEDELSAALGFLCHLVSLTTKYLGVPLRYRIFCNSSRSAIHDDGGSVFPLFQARAVEREQLDHGVLLLHRDVDCILRARDIAHQSHEHILVKLKLLFDCNVEVLE